MTRKTSRDPGVRPPVVRIKNPRLAVLCDGWWRVAICNDEHDITKMGVIRLVQRWGYDVAIPNHRKGAWKDVGNGAFERELKRRDQEG